MNKTLTFLGIISIVLIGLVGVVILMIFKIDATAFITLFSTTLPIAITAAITIDGLSKLKAQTDAVQETTARVAKSVNGNTTALIELASKNNLTLEEQEALAYIENDNRDMLASLALGGKHVAG